jgi:hypothetical protein
MNNNELNMHASTAMLYLKNNVQQMHSLARLFNRWDAASVAAHLDSHFVYYAAQLSQLLSKMIK